MSTFTLSIKTNSAAFTDEDPSLRDAAARLEVAALLAKVIESLDACLLTQGSPITLLDTNGHTVGRAAFQEGDATAFEDQAVVDRLALYLGTRESWNGGDVCEHAANLIGNVRPHPGDATPGYARSFTAETGRPWQDFGDDVDEDDVAGDEEETHVCRHCFHGIALVDGTWVAPDAGTDREDGDGIWRDICPDNDEHPNPPHEPEED